MQDYILERKNSNQLSNRDHDIILNNLISEKIYEKVCRRFKDKN